MSFLNFMFGDTLNGTDTHTSDDEEYHFVTPRNSPRNETKRSMKIAKNKTYTTKVYRDLVLKALKKELGAYVSKEGRPNSKYDSDPSIYIKFGDERLRSLRIGDHDGYERYRYKWNLRTDIDDSYEELDRGVKRYYYCLGDVDDMYAHMKSYMRKVRLNS